MQLTDEQKAQIATQLSEGAGIADIQRLITDEFKIQMTYMEVRFLMDDLDLELAKPAPEPEHESEEAVDPNTPAQDAAAELVDEGPAGGGGNVSVELDRIKNPGAALSGTVTFSDGMNAKWYVDPYGRLGLEPDQEDYQPSPEDIQEFQMELQAKMQGPGI